METPKRAVSVFGVSPTTLPWESQHTTLKYTKPLCNSQKMRYELQDGLHFMRSLTPQRLRNAYRILRSYSRSRKLGRPELRGLPLSIAFEPTTTCNLRCPHCPSGLRQFTRPTGKAGDALFEKLVAELGETLTYLIFYFQGEPYLNLRFLDWAAEASARGIYTATSTNAHYLSPEIAERTVKSGLSRLIVSIDGPTQESYGRYRIGGKLDRALEGVREVLKARKRLRSRTPYVIFQCIVFRHNEKEIPEIQRLAREVGVDKLALKSAQIYDYENGSAFIPKNEKYSRYVRQADGRYRIKNPLTNSCWKMWHSCVITWDGRVVPCCFDKDATHVLGDLKTQSFGEIWQGEKYQDFRQKLFISRKEIDICTNCTEGTKVWV